MKRDAPATHRNREPILEVLRRLFVGPMRVLEVASGSGQHAIFFARSIPELDWQTSDVDSESLASIRAWIEDEALSNVRAPIPVDASTADWAEGLGPFDAIFNANMIHISPWRVCEGLFAGAERVLDSGAPLVLYGPYRIGGEHTAESNAAFDESLRARNAEWGVRDLERVVALADAHGFDHEETVAMPANNQIVVFRSR